MSPQPATTIPFLRDTPEERATAARELPALEAAVMAARAAGERAALLVALGRLGDVHRVLEEHEPAARCLDEAVALASELRDLASLRVHRLRQAIAFHYRGEHARAEERMRELLAAFAANGEPLLEGFALQHLGKCLAETGRVAEAIRCFERALALREAAGRADLAASSRAAIAAARALPRPA
ncbi:MAG: tetratricopeptide repeat protein [Planctomycetes bacterium]|nr:tetratricopeptide repeat protein [Planctomycetota bacterium]